MAGTGQPERVALLTRQEAAAYLGVSVRTFERHVAPSVRRDRRYRAGAFQMAVLASTSP